MGCGESKHAVATAGSFSTRKKPNCNSSKKVKSVEEPHETKTTYMDKNSIKIYSDKSNVVQKKETTTNAIRHESFVKQRKDTNMSINDIKMDLPSESKQGQKNNDTLVREDVTPNKDEGHNQEVSLESQKEYDNDIKFDENLSAHHESVNKLSSCEEHKQDIIVERDNDQIKFDESLFPQNENNEKFDSNDGINLAKSDENNVSSRYELVDNVASGKKQKQGTSIERDDYINKKLNLDEKFYLEVEGKENRLVQKDNNSNNEEEEKNEDGILESLNEVIKDIKNENASIDMETNPNGGKNDVLDSAVS